MTTATYTLQSPVIVAGKTITELTFRKMKAKDLAAGDLVQGQTNKSFAILASMASTSLPVIGELDIEDLEGAQDIAAPFMGRALEMAEKASAATNAA